jgi:hypothetical protein
VCVAGVILFELSDVAELAKIFTSIFRGAGQLGIWHSHSAEGILVDMNHTFKKVNHFGELCILPVLYLFLD